MNTRKMVIRAVLVIVGLPVVLVLIAAASIYVLDRTNGTIVSLGQQRSYLLYVPRSYDRAKPTPLVISMHYAAVVLYRVQGGSHSWPGGRPLPEWMVGSTSSGINATSQMWAFFREHRLREGQTAARHE